jgi:signal transduction histidine kinase/CheY-like chemotaxis protein
LNPNPVLEFSRDGRLGCFNAAAAEMARSLGKDHPAAMLPPETATIIRTCVATGQKKLRVETSMGGRTFSWSFYPVKQNEVVHCYVGDITERRQLEDQLRHSQKLESVGRLAAGVAHDFNNVLTVIQGHTGLLRSDPALTPAMSESVQGIARAAERGSKLTSQMLAFSRRNVLHLQRLDLNEVLTHLSSLLHRTLGEDITYQFHYASELPPVFADAGLLEQVIMNLAVNARDAMPRGGQLVISTTLADIDASYVERHPAEARIGRFICLRIADTGCGMDHLTLSRIFEPFFTTKEFGKGTGLGLATVYGIVKQHQGWVEVQSQVGQGSTFKIFLPPDERAVAQEREPVPDEQNLRGHETILVVEDEPPVRWIVKDVLGKYGYNVLEAGNGVEALAMWHQHHGDIALLLTDVVMPVGISGEELAEKFTAQKPGLKVIYISGYSLQVAGKGFSMLDGPNFLQKPFDDAKLALAVRRSLDAAGG